MTLADDEEVESCRKRVGTTLRGKWHIDRLLGVGGMAAVYEATHKLGRRDAIKILHPHVAVSKELRARFEQEALAVGKLGHPGAAQIHDIDTTDDGKPFMVMELLEGESFGDRSAREALGADEVLRCADVVLDVLAVAHERGIVHRDIKPDNLFLTKEGRVLVLDFGIARMREGGQGIHTRTGAMLGTTSYMAPEQIQGRGVDGRADLYALGATMFRLLTQRRLHEADSDAELLIKMGTTHAPPLASFLPGVDPRLAAIVDRALAFDAAQRYQDARSMQQDVRALLTAGASSAAYAAPIASAPLSAAAASVPRALTKTDTQSSARRVPLALVIAIGLGLLVLPLAGWWAFSDGEPARAKPSADDDEDEDTEADESSKDGSASAESSVDPAYSGFIPPTDSAKKPGSKPLTNTKGKGKGKDKRKKRDDD